MGFADDDMSEKQPKRSTYLTRHAGARVCVVGIGKQGAKLAGALIEMGYALVGVCDRDQRALTKFQSCHPGVFTTREVADIAGVEPEAVVVATLADHHLLVIRELEKTGIRRILCEKPVVGSLAEARELTELVEKTPLSINVFHTNLFSPDYAAFKEQLQSEQLGRLVSVSGHFKPNGFGNMGCHYLAMVLNILSTRISSVESAFFSAKNPKQRAHGHEDRNGRATFLLENGASLSLENLPTVPPRDWRVVFDFEHGRAEILTKSTSYVIWDGRKATISETPFQLQGFGLKKAPETGYRILDRAVCSLLDDEPNTSFSLGCQAVEAIIAAHHCFVRNERVVLPLAQGTECLFRFS